MGLSREIFVTSDTHFGHDNIIRFCDRPFANSQEMDEVLIENWNKVVKPTDIIYHLGDVYFSSGHNALSRLNGRKRLILGNHDIGKSPHLHRTFDKIMMLRWFTEFGLLLTHVPVHITQLERERRGNTVNVHGHIHNKSSPDGPYHNVSVEVTNYTPVNIEDLRIK